MSIKLLELFAGIGACSSALDRLGIQHEIVDAVEIDKYAMASFNAIHNTDFKTQDITTWDKDIEVDLIMHGSPCQDFSLAGKQAGGDIGSGTRSSLMYETIRIVGKLRPKFVIWENVKNVLSAKHKHNFDNYLTAMQSLGYTNYYEVLNAKDYGVPQNRERVFTVSILKDSNFKFPKENVKECEVINPLKDISGKSWQFEQNVYSENSISRSLKAGGGSGNIPKVIERFEFPPKQELKLRLKDILEDEVDEKYYLSDIQIESIKASSYHTTARRIQEKDWCDTLCARDWKDPKCVRIGGIFDSEGNTHQAGSIYDSNGLSPTLDTMQGGWRQPCVEQTENSNYRIRKLTPRECWRLMGFTDEEFEKVKNINSNTQLYKQAGNSIVVNVLVEILKELLEVN